MKIALASKITEYTTGSAVFYPLTVLAKEAMKDGLDPGDFIKAGAATFAAKTANDEVKSRKKEAQAIKDAVMGMVAAPGGRNDEL